MTDVAKPKSGRDTNAHEVRWFRDNADGTFGEEFSAENRVWDTLALAWVKETQPGGGGGGGGAVTVADGADVAQGTTTDASSANTVVGILKAIKAAVTGTLTVGSHPVTNAGTFAVQADTELPAAAALADAAANPTAPAVGAFGLIWNGVTWDRAPGSAAAGLKIQSAQLPAALAANGGIKIEGVAGGVAVPTSLATNTPDVTDRAARLLGHVTVDSAPTTAVTMATQTPDVTDRAARLVGRVRLTDDTNLGTIKAASALAVAADTASVVQHSPQRADASTLCVTVTAATGVAATLTLPSAGAGLFHYITLIEIELYATAARTGGATPVVVASTNIPGTPAWDFDTGQAIGTTIRKMIQPATPIKSTAAATATTIVAPIATTGIWRITAYYYAAP